MMASSKQALGYFLAVAASLALGVGLGFGVSRLTSGERGIVVPGQDDAGDEDARRVL